MREQINQFAAEIRAVINRFSYEYDLPYAAVAGVLMLIILELGEELKQITKNP